MNKLKYELGSEVKVQVFNIITKGIIEQAQEKVTHYKDGSVSSTVLYWVNAGSEFDMKVYEEELNLVANLPLGVMK